MVSRPPVQFQLFPNIFRNSSGIRLLRQPEIFEDCALLPLNLLTPQPVHQVPEQCSRYLWQLYLADFGRNYIYFKKFDPLHEQGGQLEELCKEVRTCVVNLEIKHCSPSNPDIRIHSIPLRYPVVVIH